MTRGLLPSVAGCLLVVALAVPHVSAEPQTVEVNHALGTARVPVPPGRIVVFDMGVLDSLQRLGVEVSGVPKGFLPAYLAEYEDAAYASVGSLTEPDFEQVAALDPGVIFISARLASHYAELSRLGPTIYLGVDTADYLGSFERNMRLLGRLFGKESAVEAELARIRSAIQRIREQASGESALVVLVTGGAVSAFGPGSRYGFIYDVFGFRPVSDRIEASTHGQRISFEFILAGDPDYLFVIDRDAAVASGGGARPARQVIENELVRHTKAYRNGHIVYLDPDTWYLSGGGLESFARMIADVEEALR